MSEKQSLMERFRAAPASTRTGVIFGGLVLVVIVIGTLMTDNSKTDPNQPKIVERQNIISNNARAQTNEDLAGEIALAKKELRDQKAAIELMAEEARIKSNQGTDSGHLKEVDTLTTQLQVLQDRLASLENGSPSNKPPKVGGADGTTGKDGELVLGPDGKPMVQPSAGASGRASNDGYSQGVANEIQVVTAEKKAPAESRSKKPEPIPYLSSGANFEAVLMNGMDASTAIGANKTPTPALLRIKSEAILPNMHSFDIAECFILVGGVGNLSSERVELRSETMSCYSPSGQVWEGKVEAFVVGEDGKAGVRGRLVSKQGALLAKTFMAGFVGGLSGAFAPQQNQSLNLLTNGQVADAYQFPNGKQVLGSGVSKGLNQAGTALANFYIAQAEQMYPVLELDSGRKVTVILLKGVELKMDKKSS